MARPQLDKNIPFTGFKTHKKDTHYRPKDRSQQIFLQLFQNSSTIKSISRAFLTEWWHCVCPQTTLAQQPSVATWLYSGQCGPPCNHPLFFTSDPLIGQAERPTKSQHCCPADFTSHTQCAGDAGHQSNLIMRSSLQRHSVVSSAVHPRGLTCREILLNTHH